MVKSILPLRLIDATVKKRGKTLIGPIDLEITSTGLTAILGPNGAGKTTLLKLMHGLERLRSGAMTWSCPTHEAQKMQAFVFQTPILLRRSTAENIAYPLRLQKVAKSEALAIAYSWLQRINMDNVRDINAGYLSGGEKQKLALARALAVEPDVLFLDEPTANLDGQSTREIEALIKDAVSSGVRVVMTTHDIGQGKRLADEVFFLYRGLLHESDDAGSFFTKPKTREAAAYLDGEIVE